MGKVIAAASMSLDGYIAKADNTIGRLFDWYQSGGVELQTATPDITFHLTPESAEYWRQWTSELGAVICGRTLFDFTNGWNGRHTMGVPVVVVTQETPDSVRISLRLGEYAASRRELDRDRQAEQDQTEGGYCHPDSAADRIADFHGLEQIRVLRGIDVRVEDVDRDPGQQ
jgi:dihydrofolate reductase